MIQNVYFIVGCLFWGIIAFIFYSLRQKSFLHKKTIEIIKSKRKILILIILIVILSCVIPMGFCPIWNGEIPAHRNQYEIMTESILDGHLYIDYGDMDSKLLEMDNPYDPVMRKNWVLSTIWITLYMMDITICILELFLFFLYSYPIILSQEQV